MPNIVNDSYIDSVSNDITVLYLNRTINKSYPLKRTNWSSAVVLMYYHYNKLYIISILILQIFLKYCGVVTVDGSDIPNNHLGWCQKPVVNNWCRLTISTGFHAGFLVAINSTLQGHNISHLGKRKLIFKNALVGDMLNPRRVSFRKVKFSAKNPRSLMDLPDWGWWIVSRWSLGRV